MIGAQYTRSWAGGEAQAGGNRCRFFMEPVEDELASAREGRPIYRELEMVEIYMPGNPYSKPVQEVNDSHRQRWPKEYEAFKQGMEVALNGTPLEEWCILKRTQVFELKALGFLTVEDIANCSDLATQRAMGLSELRNRAHAFLDDAAAMALVETRSKENEVLRSQLASLQEQVNQLGEITQRQHAELMALKNAPNPLATHIPGMSDPMQLAHQAVAMQAAAVAREAPQSSLMAFANTEREKRRPGRPRKEPTEAA